MNIKPIDEQWLRRAEDRQDRLTKPRRSLGRLEEIGNRLAAIQQTECPVVNRPAILVFAADHGVCEEGVNPYPQSVTAQMVVNFLTGGAAINVLGRNAGAELVIVDAGVASDLPAREGLVRRKTAYGTRNFCKEPAMSPDQAHMCLRTGMEVAGQAINRGSTLIAVGEMGIGNTTVASALTATLTGLPVERVVGRGTGADDACMERKLSAVARAIELHKPHSVEPIEMLTRIGGFEIGAIAGACIGAASRRCAVLIDGFIATAGASLAVRMHPHVRDYLFAAHRSREVGHGPLLDMLQQRPILDLEMGLGEATGAALAIPILRAAADALSHMATFEQARVSGSASAFPSS